MRQNEESFGRYADMTVQFIGPASVTRIHNRAVLDPATARAMILMGPNARYVDASSLHIGTVALVVTFDIYVLFARKPERKS